MNELSTEKQQRAAQTLSLTGATIIALAIIAVGYYFSARAPRREIDIRTFTGNLVGVEGDVVTLRGIFDASLGTIPLDLEAPRDFSFRVDGATRFKRKDIRWPTWDELAAQGTSGTFAIESLPATDGTGSLDDLRSLHSLNPGRVDVKADFSASIHDADHPTASLVSYQLIGIPPPSLPEQAP